MWPFKKTEKKPELKYVIEFHTHGDYYIPYIIFSDGMGRMSLCGRRFTCKTLEDAEKYIANDIEVKRIQCIPPIVVAEYYKI